MQDHLVPFTVNGKKYVKDITTGEVLKVADIQLPSMNEMIDMSMENDRKSKPEEKDQDATKK